MQSNTRLFQGARFEVWIVWKFGFEIHFNYNTIFMGFDTIETTLVFKSC